ncbi:unnamed protein product, partial [Arabidopsis halleri]
IVNGRQNIRLSTNFQFTRKRASDASSSTTSTSTSTSDASSTTSASDRAKAENQAQERMKTWFEEYREKLAAAARGNANSTIIEEERLSKKPMKNSTFEEERLSKNPKTSGVCGDANSTHEAERLFKNLKTELYP